MLLVCLLTDGQTGSWMLLSFCNDGVAIMEAMFGDGPVVRRIFFLMFLGIVVWVVQMVVL